MSHNCVVYQQGSLTAHVFLSPSPLPSPVLSSKGPTNKDKLVLRILDTGGLPRQIGLLVALVSNLK